MALPPKFIDLFKLIDPFKQFALLERPQKLLALRAVAFVVFAVYAAFNTLGTIYSNTAEPSTVETIPSGQKKQLCQYAVSAGNRPDVTRCCAAHVGHCGYPHAAGSCGIHVY
jgi:hypothetical protein